jgi:hypothetical protein
MEIQWHETDPDTGERRYLRAEHFAGEWTFKWKHQRRDNWTRVRNPTRGMWEHVLESLERRLPRREGVEQEDIDAVQRILKEVIRIEELRNS